MEKSVDCGEEQDILSTMIAAAVDILENQRPQRFEVVVKHGSYTAQDLRGIDAEGILLVQMAQNIPGAVDVQCFLERLVTEAVRRDYAVIVAQRPNKKKGGERDIAYTFNHNPSKLVLH